MTNSVHCTNKSREITNELIRKLFLTIFDSLVDINSNQIHYNDEILPERVSKILMPLITELKGLTITIKEFLVAINNLYNILPYDDRRYLLEWQNSLMTNKKQRKETLNYTFKVNKFILCSL